LGVKKTPESEKILPKRVTSLVVQRPLIADIFRNPSFRMMPFGRHAQKVIVNIFAKFHVFPSPSSRSSTLRKNKVSPRITLTAAKSAAIASLLDNRSSVYTAIAMTTKNVHYADKSSNNQLSSVPLQ
jgi:hypothetical protein